MMNMKGSIITGWGMYVPQHILTNADLEKMVDTTDEWITTRTGIKQRHVANEDETCSMMAVAAAQKALACARITPEEIDLILVATNSPEYLVPSVSSLIQDQLGAACPALALVTGCTGFIYGLITAHQFIAAGTCTRILLIGVDVITRFIDWSDRNTCVLFGDGAGAVVLSADTSGSGLIAFDFGSDGQKGMELVIPGFGSAHKIDRHLIEEGKQFLTMNGREVFKFACSIVPESTERALEKVGLVSSDIDLFIPHQANARIIDRAICRLKLAREKVFMNIDWYGNTSAASIPIALNEALVKGLIKAGSHICLMSFGAGLTWATAIYKWGG